MSLILDGTLGATFNDGSNQPAAASPFGLKNRIINGDMRIDQRNAGASVSTSSGTRNFSVDRWSANFLQTNKFTVQQNAGSVTPPVGFTNYIGATSSSAYSVLSTDIFNLQQQIEGFNVSDLEFGTANAKTVTLSFWVRSSLTGTFGGALRNSDNDRSYPFTYTISTANTWEYKTVTIAGDTSGTWLKNSSTGLRLIFSLGSGVDRSGTAGAWAGANFNSATGATSVVGTNGATFYITGVQLEIGTSATPFERRLYNQELANCQRYYYRSNGTNAFSGICLAIGQSTTAAGTPLNLPVPTRTTPTSVEFSGLGIFQGSSVIAAVTSVAIDANGGNFTPYITFSTASGLTANTLYRVLTNNNTAGYIGLSAEL